MKKIQVLAVYIAMAEYLNLGYFNLSFFSDYFAVRIYLINQYIFIIKRQYLANDDGLPITQVENQTN